MSKYSLRLVVAVVLSSISGCAGILSVPSLEEQAALLRQADFSPDTRYAIVSRSTNAHESSIYPIGDRIAPAIANTVAEMLGIQAEALSHAAGSPWSGELSRAEKETGWLTSTDSSEFFRRSGFDGYVLITVYEALEYYDIPNEPGRERIFLTYDPVFHIISLPESEDRVLMMQEGLSGRFSCEMLGDNLKDAPRCVDTFVKRFRRALDARLSLYETKVSQG